MEQKLKALVIGVGGTLVYYVLLLAVAFVSSHFDSDGGLKFMIVMALPVIPGMVPGGLLSLLLGFGFHETGFSIGCLISAPLVHSYLAYLWINRRTSARGV